MSQGIGKGLYKGGVCSAKDFVPSLLSTVMGIGKGIWSLTSDPLKVSLELTASCKGLFEYLKNNLNQEQLDHIASELRDCITKWDMLDDQEKGEYIGYIIGFYGVDILASGGSIGAIKYFREIKRANAILTLESLSSSKISFQQISKEAQLFNQQRAAFIKESKLHVGQQEKHIISSKNFKQNASELQISIEELDAATRPRMGTGLPSRGEFGHAGYQEIIEYDRQIGIYVSKDGSQRLPTSIGKIHYNKSGGYHVVPSHPDMLKFKRGE